MGIFENLLNRKEKICVVGLGYVGIPLAVELSKYFDVIGFDTNKNKIETYKTGIDCTCEIGNSKIKKSNISFTYNEKDLNCASFFIVAVPTPVYNDNTPDLRCLISASKIVGKYLKKGDYVVYESTVSPGTTEKMCIKILEDKSNLKCIKDFKVGYSPERINPGDKKHTLQNTVKIVSAVDAESLKDISDIYDLVVKAGIYKAESIKIAEAAKIIENTQRDINIALMNELSIIFDKLGLDTKKVINAAKTKWNFQYFEPGLVGGHCISVDPYYLIYSSLKKGYSSELLIASRKVNDSMGKFISEVIIRKIIKYNLIPENLKVGVLGFSYKENCMDIRNTQVFSIINFLNKYGLQILVADDLVSKTEVKGCYNIDLVPENDLKNLDILVLAVPHNKYYSYILSNLDYIFNFDDKKCKKIFIDVKSIFYDNDKIKELFDYYSL